MSEIPTPTDQEHCVAMIEHSKLWKLDGDLMRCRKCNRALIWSRRNEEMIHASCCVNKDIKPWAIFERDLITARAELTESQAQVVALREACSAAKKYLEPDLAEPGRTVFWGLVSALTQTAPPVVTQAKYNDLWQHAEKLAGVLDEADGSSDHIRGDACLTKKHREARNRVLAAHETRKEQA